MNVLFTINNLSPASGGPSRSVPALCKSLSGFGISPTLLGLEFGGSSGNVAPEASFHQERVPCRRPLWRYLSWTPEFRARVVQTVETLAPQIIHDTGLWSLTNWTVSNLGSQFQLPMVVSPRGTLEPWALKYRAYKKVVAWNVYQKRNLSRAMVLHATAESEAESFRRLKLKNPIAVIPNGVHIPALPLTRCRGATKTVLFLSRIHPKKGLADLVQAWAVVRPKGWAVIVAGDDNNAHGHEIKRLLQHHRCASDFQWVGQVEDSSKEALYSNADLFVLPSHSENFGMVVAEALSYGIPVITTKGTPWAHIEQHRCGWWTDLGPVALAEAIRYAVNMSDTERAEMGLRGRELVQKEFSWLTAAKNMASVYNWILGKGDKPDCVFLSNEGG